LVVVGPTLCGIGQLLLQALTPAGLGIELTAQVGCQPGERFDLG
jgi:hypothetical protein